eukprot:1160269-Pelagomonas_calceolata.AAC.1
MFSRPPSEAGQTGRVGKVCNTQLIQKQQNGLSSNKEVEEEKPKKANGDLPASAKGDLKSITITYFDDKSSRQWKNTFEVCDVYLFVSVQP